MLLTITTTYQPATDMGYLLHKSPDTLHSKKLPFGTGYVFYPEATAQQCTAALLLDIDPVGLVRKDRGAAFPLAQYVNDRPYVASSFLSVAINRIFNTLLSGRSKERPQLVATAMPLHATIHALPCRADESLVAELFEPLGYQTHIRSQTLDPQYPDWGNSPYYQLKLEKNCPLRELLIHLYVLIPVLDNKKHYFIGEDEIEKLLQYGEGWLKDHPQKELIAKRYFKNMRSLSRIALDRLKEEAPPDNEEHDEQVAADAQEEALEETLDKSTETTEQADALPEKKLSLHKQRHAAVMAALKAHNASSVLDLGCGDGKLLRSLKHERSFAKVAGCDVSIRCLEIAQERLKPERQKKGEPELALFQSALTYRDNRFGEYDAIVLVEVIEHVDGSRLGALAQVVFGDAQPRLVLVTTPNQEYNVLFEGLAAGQLRHADHRFEWTRAEFQDWATGTASAHGYEVSIQGIGEVDADKGTPSQMAVFIKQEREK